MSSTALSVSAIQAALKSYSPGVLAPSPGGRRAAVALVLRHGDTAPSCLFIHRAEHPQDPWSGHMGFPGGRVEDTDESPLAGVLRETCEELGLDLDHTASLLGRLSDVAAMAQGRPVPLVITPFVFALQQSPRLVPNHEVQEAVWVPLDHLADPGNRDSFVWQHGNRRRKLPCYHYHGKMIWGLSLAMVTELLRVVRTS